MKLFRRGDRTQIRFLRIRLFIIGLKDLLTMRFYRYVDPSPLKPSTYRSYKTVGEFKTKIKWRPELGELNENRIHNMEECARRISGIRIKPGQYFSLRRIIGHPTGERGGYKDGPMLINGKLKHVSGGGICQVSTTLFNVGLMSGMRIIEKWNHTWDVWGGDKRFIDLGRDATYAYGRRDLIIQNPYDQALILVMEVDRVNLHLNTIIMAKETIDVKAEVSVDVQEINNLRT